MKILIVDDEKSIASLLQDYLELTGDYAISQAHSGVEALERIREEKPDLIILDVMMPEMSGYQVVEALKSQARTANIPIILASVADALSPAEKKKLGVMDFLPKPIDFRRLNALLAQTASPMRRFFGARAMQLTA